MYILAPLMRKSKIFSMVSIYHWYFYDLRNFVHAESKREFIIHFVEQSYDVMFSRKEISHGQFDSFKANDGISKPHKSN